MGKVASMNPDNMVAAGLMDDFDGTVTKVRLIPWDYDGKIDHHVLAAQVTVKNDDGTETVEHLSAGDLELFAPSMDGENPVPLTKDGATTEELEGVFALQVGKKEALANSTNWAQWIQAALQAGFPPSKLAADVRCFEGVYGHWNRIPQKKRSGLVRPAPAAGERAKSNDILVLTELKTPPAGTAKPTTGAVKTAATTSAKPATTTATTAPAAGGDLDAKLVEIVRKALVGQAEGLSKSKLPGAALAGLAPADKGKGVKRVVDAEFLSGHEDLWVFDADSGTVISIEG